MKEAVMPSPLIIGLVAVHENQALANATHEYGYYLKSFGYDYYALNIADSAHAQILFDRLKDGSVAFAFGLQGVGSTLQTANGESIWTVFRTPFVGLHYDHPCHNPYNHINASPYVGCLYFSRSFAEVKEHYLPSKQLVGSLDPGFFSFPKYKGTPFRDRPIKLLYLKSGASLDDILEDVRRFPPELQKGFFSIAREMQNNPNCEATKMVADLFETYGIARQRFEIQFWDIVRLLDRYVRRGRAILFVEWLKKQDGAVIVGDGWDFIDRKDSRAEFRPALSMDDSVYLYEQSQFVCNTSPHGRDIVHERVILGLAAGCCVLSDTNEWWQSRFLNVPALTFFDWTLELDQQLGTLIRDMDGAAQAAMTARQDVIERFQKISLKNVYRFIMDVKDFGDACSP